MDYRTYETSSLHERWIWAEAQSNVEYQNPELWKWHRKDGRFLSKWQEQFERTVDIADIIKTSIFQGKAN